jgi:hypothetical protein
MLARVLRQHGHKHFNRLGAPSRFRRLSLAESSNKLHGFIIAFSQV